MSYPLKDCPYCGDEISNVSRNGTLITKGKYAHKKACTACWPLAMLEAKAKAVERAERVLDDPIDLFVYGRVVVI